jgi:phospholipase/lecithinase/hemolysin
MSGAVPIGRDSEGSSMAKRLFILVASLCVVAPSQAGADVYTFNQIYVFGDSLSDTGNLESRVEALGFGASYLVPPKYTAGRVTNGADTTPASTKYVANGKYNVVWHEQLAKLAGMIDPAGPSLGNGNKQNYAFAGAVADDTNQTTKVKSTVLGDVIVDNVVKQVNDFLALKNVPAKALYIINGGGNDLRNVFFPPDSETLKDLSTVSVDNVTKVAVNAADKIASYIAKLIAAGAPQFLWPDVPPLDKTPRFLPIDAMKIGDNTKTIGDALAAAVPAYKAEEEKQIGLLQKGNVKIAEADIYSAVNNIIANPNKFGYKNVTDIAQGKNVNPDDYLFWDPFHPTSHGHYDIAQLADVALMNAGLCIVTPEPGPLVLGAFGALVGAGIYRFRRRAA